MIKEQISKGDFTDIYLALSYFNEFMGLRLMEKNRIGWIGWNNRRRMNPRLRRRIEKNMDDGHWVDVANLAMMAWANGLKRKK